MTTEERFERIEADLAETNKTLAETNRVLGETTKLINRIGKYAMILARDFDTRIAALEGRDL